MSPTKAQKIRMLNAIAPFFAKMSDSFAFYAVLLYAIVLPNIAALLVVGIWVDSIEELPILIIPFFIGFGVSFYAQISYFVSLLYRSEADQPDATWSTSRIVVMALAEYFQIVNVFAVLYIFLSHRVGDYFVFVDAANTDKPLGLVSGLYFSLVTGTTVGYGDIYAASPCARVIVMGQIVVTLIYVAVILGVVPTVAREMGKSNRVPPSNEVKKRAIDDATQ
jgi:ion channel